MEQSETVLENRQKAQRKIDGFTPPDFTKLYAGHESYKSEFQYALNYANYRFDQNQMRDHVKKYIKREVSHIPAYEFVGLGTIAWILNNSGYIEENVLTRFTQKINELWQKYRVPVKDTVDELSAKQVQFKQNTSLVLAELEGYLDDVLLSRENIVPIKDIIEKYTKYVKYDREKVAGHFSKVRSMLSEDVENVKDRQKLEAAIDQILYLLIKSTDTEELKQNKPRAKKKLKPSAYVKKVKYQKEDKELGFVSLSPELIIEAEVVFTFNTKTRKACRYVAETGQKLLVKGTTIINFDATLSQMKTVRKPKEFIDNVSNSGKVSQRKLFDSLTTTASVPSGRINEETLIIKVFK